MCRPFPSTWQLLRSKIKSAGLPFSALRWYRLFSGCLLLALFLPWALINRLALWVDELLFPKYRSTVIRDPLFIVGPPRSGTTLLHRLIAEDTSQFTTFPLWELLLAPAICQKYLWIGIWRVDRILGSPLHRLLSWTESTVGRCLVQFHPTSLQMPEEDYLLLATQRTCFLFVLAFPECNAVWDLGQFDERFSDSQRARVLHAYRRLVQRHLYVRGPEKHYLSKNPSFTGWIHSLHREFSDARFVGLTRTPEETIPSQLSSIGPAMAWFGHDVKQPETVQRFVDLFESYYRRVLVDMPQLPREQVRLLRYNDLKRAPCEEVVSALDHLGYSVSDDFFDRLSLAASAAAKYRSGHRYSLDEFGLTDQQIRQAIGSAEHPDPLDSKSSMLNRRGQSNDYDREEAAKTA